MSLAHLVWHPPWKTDALKWPSLTVEWLPNLEEPFDKDYSVQKMIFYAFQSDILPEFIYFGSSRHTHKLSLTPTRSTIAFGANQMNRLDILLVFWRYRGGGTFEVIPIAGDTISFRSLRGRSRALVATKELTGRAKIESSWSLAC